MIDLILAVALASTGANLDHGHDHGHGHADTHDAASSTVSADVRTVDTAARKTLMRHEAMTELGMPSMVMEFSISDDVDISLFEPGAALMVTVINGDDGLQVIAAEAEHGHP